MVIVTAVMATVVSMIRAEQWRIHRWAFTCFHAVSCGFRLAKIPASCETHAAHVTAPMNWQRIEMPYSMSDAGEMSP